VTWVERTHVYLADADGRKPAGCSTKSKGVQSSERILFDARFREVKAYWRVNCVISPGSLFAPLSPRVLREVCRTDDPAIVGNGFAA
jgi:hypothetical protein